MENDRKALLFSTKPFVLLPNIFITAEERFSNFKFGATISWLNRVWNGYAHCQLVYSFRNTQLSHPVACFLKTSTTYRDDTFFTLVSPEWVRESLNVLWLSVNFS